MKKLKSKSDSKKYVSRLALAKGAMKVVEDKKTGRQKIKVDEKKFAEIFLNPVPPKHQPWLNKKQMKAYKKLRTMFLKGIQNENINS